MITNRTYLGHLQLLVEHMNYYNRMSPFPIYDTSYVKDVEYKIKEMKNDQLKDYDSEGVVACKYCKSLHIKTDEDDNDICMRCGSINELQEFSSIYKYNEYLTKKDND